MNLLGHESKPIKYSKTQDPPIASPVLLFNNYKSHPTAVFKNPRKKTRSPTLSLSRREANTVHIYPYKTLNIFGDEEDKRH
jgi:hypothetical protein